MDGERSGPSARLSSLVEWSPRVTGVGLVGGGAGAFIGAVHRMAARLDDRFERVAGALSSTPDEAIASGRDLGLDPGRTSANLRWQADASSA